MEIRFMDPKRIESVQELINRDPEFRLASKHMCGNILLAVDDKQCIFKMCGGVLTDILLDPTPMDAWNFFIRAPAESWKLFLMPVPPPFYHNSLEYQ